MVCLFSYKGCELLQIVLQLIENCDVSHLEDEPNPHVVRVGWSADLTSMQLGKIFLLCTLFI